MDSVRRMRGARILLLCAAASWTAAALARAEARLPITERAAEFALPADSLRLDLPGRWIRPSTLVVVANGDTLRPGVAYDLEPTEGILEFRDLPDSGRVTIRYESIPLTIGRVFQIPVRLEAGPSPSTVVPPKAGGRREESSRARLDLRGSKTVSLEVGSAQDLTVRQSLDVNLSGEIVSGVSVRGVLSDRGTPLQPEGSTTELSDLDRVLLEVEGPSAGMTLGDFVLRGPAGGFAAFERQLEGVRLHATRSGASGVAAAAKVPGLFFSFEFLGEEGKQGPYSLRPPAAPIEAVIVAGSERIWIDGELLVRGDDRDYSIDYAASTVTFSGRRIITRSSRIAVDCQVSAQPYQRQAYSGELRWARAAGERGWDVGLTASYYTERDDRSSPIGGPLTDEEKASLREAGDSLTVDLESGVECGAVGSGDYIVIEADELQPVHFRYVGVGEGTCKVRFDEVGDGRGDYADSTLIGGERIYQYLGPRRGRFLPGRAVPRPSRRDLVDLAVVGGGLGGFRYDLELAGSLDDPNTYSSLDDGDRTGGALRARVSRAAEVLRVADRNLGTWGVEMALLERDDRFRSPGRVDPAWFGYEWGVDGERLETGLSRRIALLRHEPGAGFSLEGGIETLGNRRDLDASRRRFKLQRSGRIFGNAEWSRTTTEDRAESMLTRGEREVDGFRVGARVGRFEAGGAYSQESTERGEGDARSGSRFDEWQASATMRWNQEKGRIVLTRSDRADETIQGSTRQDAGRAVTWDLQAVDARPGRALEGRFIRRRLDLPGGGDARNDAANLIWTAQSVSGRIGHQLRADLATEETEERIKLIEFVGVGRGRYDSLGVYVGTGDYEVVLKPSGVKRLERAMEASWRLDLAPGRGGAGEPAGQALDRLWKSSQWLLYLTSAARTAGSATDFWRDLPSLLAGRVSGVPLSSIRIRGEASALPESRIASPRLRFEQERSRSAQYQGIQSRKARDLVSFSVRSAPGKGWTLEQEMLGDREEEWTRREEAPSQESVSGWRSLRARSSAWLRVGGEWTLRSSASLRRRKRAGAEETILVGQLSPGVQWSAPPRARLDLSATRTWLDEGALEIPGLEKPGWTMRGQISIRLKDYLDATTQIDLDDPDRGRSVAGGRAELRASF